MSVLTKEAILKGASHVETVRVEALDGEIQLRPLTSAEHAKVEAVQARAIRLDLSGAMGRGGGFDKSKAVPSMDMEAFARAEHESNCLTAAYGMSVAGSEWTPEEVGRLRPGAVEEIAKHVHRLSGTTSGEKALLDSFRTEFSGSGDPGAAAAGGAAGEDPGGANAGATDGPPGGGPLSVGVLRPAGTGDERET